MGYGRTFYLIIDSYSVLYIHHINTELASSIEWIRLNRMIVMYWTGPVRAGPGRVGC